MLIVWFFVAAIAAAAPIPLIKEYTESGDYLYVIASLASYILLVIAYIIILDDKDITILYPMLKVLSVLIVVVAGMIVFQNKITVKSAIGIFLAIVSLWLLSSQV